MSDRRAIEENLLALLLAPYSQHHLLTETLVELDTFQELDATEARPSLLELALQHLNRSKYPSPNQTDFLSALLSRTRQPFQPGRELAVAQQALQAQQSDVWKQLLEHPAAPPREVWHAARWLPERKSWSTDWTWPVALVRIWPGKPHPSLAELFRQGWPAVAPSHSVSWLGHITPAHLPLAHALKHVPTPQDVALWHRRCHEGELSADAVQQLERQWGGLVQKASSMSLPPVPPDQVLFKLLKAGPKPNLKENLERLSTSDVPWTELRFKDRGPNNKQCLWSPVGWILYQLLRSNPSDFRRVTYKAWEDAIGLSGLIQPDREAVPGVTEGGVHALAFCKDNSMPAPDVQQMDKASTVRYLEDAVTLTEVLYNKGDDYKREAPALPSAISELVSFIWSRTSDRYGQKNLLGRAPVTHAAPALSRLFKLGLGVPHNDPKLMEDRINLVVSWSCSALLDDRQKQDLLFNALAVGTWRTRVEQPLIDRLTKLLDTSQEPWWDHPAVPLIDSFVRAPQCDYYRPLTDHLRAIRRTVHLETVSAPSVDPSVAPAQPRRRLRS